MIERPTIDEIMDMTGATLPNVPVVEERKYPTVEEAQATSRQNRLDEIEAHRLLAENMVAIDLGDNRPAAEIARAMGYMAARPMSEDGATT